MPKISIKNLRVYSNIVQLKEFLHKMNINPLHFIIPGVLSFGAAFFEGISMALLVPLAKGVIEMDFGFLRELPVFGNIVAAFPQQFSASNSSIFILLVGLIFTAAVIKNILLYTSSLSISYQVRKFSNNMRKLVFHRYLSFGKHFFDRSNVGDLSNTLVNFTNIIANQIIDLHSTLTRSLTLIVYLILMFVISWKLTLILIPIFPILYYCVRRLMGKLKETSKHFAYHQGELSKRIFNILSCIPLVKSYTREEEEKKQFSSISDLVKKLEFSMDKKIQLISPLQETITLAVILLLVSIMAFTVAKGQSGIMAGFLVYIYLIRRSQVGFAEITKFKAVLARISGPTAEVLKVFDDKDKVFIVDGQRQFTGLQRGIEFNHLNFSYLKERQIVKDITFFIEKGKMIAIVGPTGAGKTTLINLILRFYDCPVSSILIDGMDIREIMLKSLRSHIALVSQDTLLFNDTLRKNITYGLDKVTDERLIDVVKKARLYDFIMELPDRFDTLIGDRGVKLSGGEKQRVSIARAILKGAEILILDEATSSLDTRTEKLIQEAINEAIKDKTAIVIAHRLSTIKSADKIVIIEDGRMIEQGTLNDLLEKQGKFYQYWQEQKFY